MVAKVRFWLLEMSILIAMASFDVMILKSLFLYSLFITRPCFTRKATPPLGRFSANLIVFYIVDGLKGDLIICFNALILLCGDHVNIHAALN